MRILKRPPRVRRSNHNVNRSRHFQIEPLEHRLVLSGAPLGDPLMLGSVAEEVPVSIAPIASTAAADESAPELTLASSPADALVYASQTAAEFQTAQTSAAVVSDPFAAVEAINQFAYDLYQHFMQEEGNLFLSPVSISTALAMAYAGAAGNTAAQMADVLHFDPADDGLHESFGSLMESLNTSGETNAFDLSVANSLWLQQGCSFKDTYLQLMQSAYSGGLNEVDFQTDPEAAREMINTWIEQQTNGMIQDMLGQGAISEATRSVLANAIYFNAQWAHPFKATNTHDRVFTLESGEQIDVPTMYLREQLRYTQQDGFQVLELPYEGEKLSMVLLLPQEDTSLNDLGGDTLTEVNNWLAQGAEKQDVIVRLPKFKTEVSSSLTELLKGMGMSDAFSPRAADFSGMSDGGDLRISDVLHNAIVEVDEEGAEAVAATAVISVGCAPGTSSQSIEFTADHPFHFYIRDNETGAMLFMGRMNDPLQASNDLAPTVVAIEDSGDVENEDSSPTSPEVPGTPPVDLPSQTTPQNTPVNTAPSDTPSTSTPTDDDYPARSEEDETPSDVLAEELTTGFERFASQEEFKEYVIADALQRYEYLFGREYSYIAFSIVGASALYQSETNTQVIGVDESDLMETDGDYLYMLSDGELVIVDLGSPDDPSVAARVEFDQAIESMCLAGDRLTLISKGFEGKFSVTVLDVANRNAPMLVQQTTFDGYLYDSRVIADKVYLVIRDYSCCLPRPETIPIEEDASDGDATQPRYRYETKEEYRQRVEEQWADYVVSKYTCQDVSGEVIDGGWITEPTDIYKPRESEGLSSLSTIAVIDMASDEPGPTDSISVPTGSISAVYATTESLYVLGTAIYGSYGDWIVWGGPSTETVINKIDLTGDDGGLQWVASGKVAGQVLDQFSVDEHGGLLRVATTDPLGVDIQQSNLFVLEQDGSVLEVIGSVEGLAPGEQIYSVRFWGDQAYVVTFRNIDPLFAIDLSNPTNPEVKGELEITGFSTYLHAIEGGFLIGLGCDADVETGTFQEPQVSLFDVSDLSNPELVDRFAIDTAVVGRRDIFSDHHVVAYYPESQILTVSIADVATGLLEEVNGACVNDLFVFHVDTTGATAGLELLGRIEHDASVLRSVQIGDRLISISGEAIQVHNLGDPEQVVATLAIRETVAVPLLPNTSHPGGDSNSNTEETKARWTDPAIETFAVTSLPISAEVITALAQALTAKKGGNNSDTQTQAQEAAHRQWLFATSSQQENNGESRQKSFQAAEFDVPAPTILGEWW